MVFKPAAYDVKTPPTRSRPPAAGIYQPAPRINRESFNRQLPSLNLALPPWARSFPAPGIRHYGSNGLSRASGFTLLEVLIAMAIMAIVLVSVYRLHLQTLSMTTANQFYTQAPLLAQSKMALLEATSSDLVSGDSGDFGDKFPGYSWTVTTEDVSSEILGEVAEDLQRIDITVALNESGYAYSVRSYRLKRE